MCKPLFPFVLMQNKRIDASTTSITVVASFKLSSVIILYVMRVLVSCAQACELSRKTPQVKYSPHQLK